jgi:uroporphyrinogen III methyltransferase/synthase
MSKLDPAETGKPGSTQRPLQGRTVLVTRARMQSESLTSKLEALGAQVIHFPTIEIVPPESWDQLDAALRRLGGYDWIVFTSANGVRFFFERLNDLELTDYLDMLATTTLCAIGPATASAIEKRGAVANLVASESSSEGALTAIIKHAGDVKNINGLRFLIPRARIAREVLPEGLRKLGAEVDTVETYQTVKPDVDPESVNLLFKENSIDAITFTSSSTVSNFVELAGLTDLSRLLDATLVACIGPATAETAARMGLTRVIQPDMHNSAALVEAIVASLAKL